MNDKCNKICPCDYRFAGHCMFLGNTQAFLPCEMYSAGTCETNVTMAEKEEE